MALPGMNNISLVELGKRSFKQFQEDDMSTYSAALVYRVLLAIFPFLLFLLTFLGALGLSEFFTWVLDQARSAMAADVYSQVEKIVNQVQGGANGGLLSFGLIAALWSAAAGVRSLINALNQAYDIEDERAIWKLYPLSIVYTVGLAVLFIVAVGLMFLGPQTAEWLAGQIGLGDVFVTLWTWLRIPVAVVVMMVAVAVIYYFLPNLDQPFKIVTPGSVVAVVAWVLASLVFFFYVSNFSNYNATYGSLGGVIVFMLYLFISAATLLFGAEVNAEIYKSEYASPDDNVADDARIGAQRA